MLFNFVRQLAAPERHFADDASPELPNQLPNFGSILLIFD